MNTCPIYRRSGGHSYQSTIPGPIGSILNPGFDLDAHHDLPFASTLCGSCSDVCPVKIDIHEQLYRWRQYIHDRGKLSRTKRIGISAANVILSRPRLYRLAGKMGRWALARMPRWMIYNRLNVWGNERELPVPPPQSFRDWYQQNRPS